MRWQVHPWKKIMFPDKSPPRVAVLPGDESPILGNGHPAPVPAQDVQVAPGGDAERILVFPASLFNEAPDTSLRPFSGFRTDAPEMAGRIFPKGVKEEDFSLRNSVEHNEDFIQVVAVVVPWHAASRQVWCFRRGETEGRLGGKLSCLPGGHVNISDAWVSDPRVDGSPLLWSGDLLDVTFRAALREMGEELSEWEHNWKNHHSDCRLILAGVVRETSTPVDRVHFGFVYRLDLATLDIPMRFAKEAGAGAGWSRADEVADGVAPIGHEQVQVENWSVHVARHLGETSPVRIGS